jgi:ATP-dependent Clp protease ATP-binding subunit ClpA
MTSNIGSHAIIDMSEKGEPDELIQAHVRGELRKHLRPELINRIDETVIFHQLTRKDLAGIVDIQLANLRKRLAERKLTLELTPAEHVVFRLEYRHDHAASDLYFGGAVSTDAAGQFVANRSAQDTLTGGATAWF